MTQGSIPRLLIGFAIPLLIGNLFQQLYNTVDSVVVGNFVSKQALAAVGCTGPIINMLIGVFMGFSSGAGVVISQFYGAKDEEKLHDSVQTAVTLTLLLCVVLTAIGVTATPLMLRLMDTPEDVFPEAVQYLRIYFGGMSGMLVYNIGSGILRAVGDSTRPLYFLIFSTLLNTVLDVVFVRFFSWGIAGAAWATVIAQCLSAILVMLLLSRAQTAYRVDYRHLRLHRSILRKICAIGVPSALQMGITAFSNVFVQSYVNRFESSCMAGWAAYNRIDAFAMLPLMSLSLSITTFVGQNLGAGDYGRARSAPRVGMLMGLVIMAVILTPLMIFAPTLVKLFNGDAEVIRYGTWFIRVISPFYLTFAANQVYMGVLRGAGNTRTTMFVSLGSFVLFRQVYLYISYHLGGGLTAVTLGYPVGWVLCTVLLSAYYHGRHNTLLYPERAAAE
ncbi:MAG: MATE family efflux transporter [Oscillospiraceae bacterium]|nr:MATE family efflux transporter [Oscillospiraceae bacterium]